VAGKIDKEKMKEQSGRGGAGQGRRDKEKHE
jgi:hypothetical protein